MNKIMILTISFSWTLLDTMKAVTLLRKVHFLHDRRI